MMNQDDLVLVSVDDHLIEPPDMFSRVEHRHRERAPRVEVRDSADYWVFEDVEWPTIRLNAVAGRVAQELNSEPGAFEEMRPGCYNVDERIKDMDANGVAASLCFPSWPGFCGQRLAGGKDKDLVLAMVRAYNDWHIDAWCGAYPDRLIPLAILPLWDPELCAAEVQRVAAKGCHAVSWSENTTSLGYPSIHTDAWDPFFAVCEELETTICIHFGSSARPKLTAPDGPAGINITLFSVTAQFTAVEIIWSPVPHKFPKLKFMLSEGGAGWVPFLMEKMDNTFEHHGKWSGRDFRGKLPSEILRSNIVTCFIQDELAIKNRDVIGVENLTWECDYPHGDTTWPRSPESFAPYLDVLSEAEADAITHRNAMRLFQFDPFAVRPKEECTVGALRARSRDHDVSPQTSRHYAAQGMLVR
jgi:predicted TIM-barrel fold metal-dependent hydrolase